MKRFITLAAILCMIAMISGCSLLRGAIHKAGDLVADKTARPAVNLHTAEPTDGAAPEPSLNPSASPEAEPTGAKPTDADALNEYASAALGILFTLPDSWMGKYRVREGDGYLTVYFAPEAPIDETMGDGQLFTVVVKESEDDCGFFDNEREIEINCVTYLCGTSTDVSYGEGQPEYETYAAMMRDIPAVFASIRAAESNER